MARNNPEGRESRPEQQSDQWWRLFSKPISAFSLPLVRTDFPAPFAVTSGQMAALYLTQSKCKYGARVSALVRGCPLLTLLHTFPPPLLDAERQGHLYIDAGGATTLRGPASLNCSLEGSRFQEHPVWTADDGERSLLRV